MRTLALAITFALAFPAGQAAAGNPAAGRVIAEKVCAACHGPDGNKPNTPETPILAGQHRDYLVRALADYRSGARRNAVMQGFAAQLSKKDIEDVSAWYASRKSALSSPR